MMVEDTSFLNDHKAVALIMSSPDLTTHERINKCVRNFDSAVYHKEKQTAVFSGTYVKFTQQPATKKHLLSTGNKMLAEASPLDPVWDIDFREDVPRTNNPCQWVVENLHGEAHSAGCEGICKRDTGLAHTTSASRFHSRTANAGSQDLSPAPRPGR